MKKFGRAYELQIATGPVWEDMQKTITIKSPLRIDFEIDRHNRSVANKGTFKIYNLGKNTRNAIAGFKPGTWCGIKFYAGYPDPLVPGKPLPLVFYGNMVKTSTSLGKTDIVTEIEAMDGQFAMTESYLEETLSKEYDTFDIIQALSKQLLRLDDKQTPHIGTFDNRAVRTVTLSGNVWDNLVRYTGGRCFIDNGRFIALQPDEWLDKKKQEGKKEDENLFEISVQTGLIGQPKEDEQGVVEIEMVLEPSLKVGELVSLNSIADPKYYGKYIVRGIKHSCSANDKGEEKCSTKATLGKAALGTPAKDGNNKAAPAAQDLKELLDILKGNVSGGIHCHRLGTIQSFNPETQTASILLNVVVEDTSEGKKVPAAGKAGEAKGKRPLLKNVPVFIPAGGQAALTMPVAKDDTCLVLFSDINIDQWVENGAEITPSSSITARSHDITDALAIVGFRNKGNAIKGYDAKNAELRNAGAILAACGDGKIRIESKTESLHGALIELIGCLMKFTVANSAGPATPNEDTKNTLAKIETRLGSLLK